MKIGDIVFEIQAKYDHRVKWIIIDNNHMLEGKVSCCLLVGVSHNNMGVTWLDFHNNLALLPEQPELAHLTEMLFR